eukprot:7211701-Prymnesium_polylepis.1
MTHHTAPFTTPRPPSPPLTLTPQPRRPPPLPLFWQVVDHMFDGPDDADAEATLIEASGADDEVVGTVGSHSSVTPSS